MTIAHPAPPSTRTERGIALYRERHDEIKRTGPYTYRVPSCSGADSYIVDVRAGFCLCPDHQRAKALGEACKHRTAAEIFRAKRRAVVLPNSSGASL